MYATVEQAIESIATTNKAGAQVDAPYKVIFVSEKKSLVKSRLTGDPTPASKEVVTVVKQATYNFSGKTYEELVSSGKLPNIEAVAGAGTYCHPVSDNNLLMKHNKQEQTYLRVYKTKQGHMFGSKTLEIYDKTRKRMSEEQYSAWMAEYGKDGSKKGVSDVYNIKTDGIVAIYKGDNVIYENPAWGWVDV